jgi:hypothetical protein
MPQHPIIYAEGNAIPSTWERELVRNIKVFDENKNISKNETVTNQNNSFGFNIPNNFTACLCLTPLDSRETVSNIFKVDLSPRAINIRPIDTVTKEIIVLIPTLSKASEGRMTTESEVIVQYSNNWIRKKVAIVPMPTSKLM